MSISTLFCSILCILLFKSAFIKKMEKNRKGQFYSNSKQFSRSFEQKSFVLKTITIFCVFDEFTNLNSSDAIIDITTH